jgi:hypothetical protein
LATVADPFSHTEAGRHNLENLARYYDLDLIRYTMGTRLFERATRASFEDTGEPLKLIEAAIYTVPYHVAQVMGIRLVMFGENSSYEYGSSRADTEDAVTSILRTQEGLMNNLQWYEDHGMSKEHVRQVVATSAIPVTACFMSYFKPWSSVTNLQIAQARGFKSLDDTGEWFRRGTVEQFEQIDSVAYMVHLWLKYPKFGFQRAMDIASRRCREGLMTLDEVKQVAVQVDPILDRRAMVDFCHTLGYVEEEFWAIVNKWRNPEIFEGGYKWQCL